MHHFVHKCAESICTPKYNILTQPWSYSSSLRHLATIAQAERTAQMLSPNASNILSSIQICPPHLYIICCILLPGTYTITSCDIISLYVYTQYLLKPSTQLIFKHFLYKSNSVMGTDILQSHIYL